MAIIKCPECGRDVSNKAEKCIHCGYPLHQEAAAPQNPGEADSKNRINLDDPGYNSSSPGQVVVQNNKAKILWVILGTIAMIAIAVGIVMYNGNKSKSDNNDNTYYSHNNCMFIGYADPNHPLNGQSKVSTEPKYGYRPVYVNRDDIYNTYHFH